MIWKSLIKYLTATKRTAIEQSRMVRGTLAHPKCGWNGGCIHYSPVSLHALCSPWWCWAACCAPPVTVSSHHSCWCWEAIWANWNREIKMGWGSLHWAGLVSKPVFTLSCFCDHFVFPPVQVRLVGEVLRRLKSFFCSLVITPNLSGAFQYLALSTAEKPLGFFQQVPQSRLGILHNPASPWREIKAHGGVKPVQLTWCKLQHALVWARRSAVVQQCLHGGYFRLP